MGRDKPGHNGAIRRNAMMTQRYLTRRRFLSVAAIALARGSIDPPPPNPRPTARPCARSTSACRSRRRTWCTPRPMWRRRSASSPSAASTPTSCSSRAASRRPRRSPPRRARAIVSVNDVSIGRGLKVQQIWGLAPRMPQAYMVQEGITTAAAAQGQAAVRHRRRRRRLQLAHGPRGAEIRRTRPRTTRSSSPRPPPAACPA